MEAVPYKYRQQKVKPLYKRTYKSDRINIEVERQKNKPPKVDRMRFVFSIRLI